MGVWDGGSIEQPGRFKGNVRILLSMHLLPRTTHKCISFELRAPRASGVAPTLLH